MKIPVFVSSPTKLNAAQHCVRASNFDKLDSGWGIDTLSYSAKNNLGDVNCDGQVDLLDVAPFVDALTNGEFNSKADINGDGAVDLLDVAPFVALLVG